MKKSSLHIFGISITAFMLIVLVWCMNFGWHIPYINWAPWDLASYLVQHQRPASECFDLVWFEIMSPTQGEQRALCVHKYASLAKDPTACELLMPSSYGLSCVGGATRFLPCFFSDKRTVVWSEGNLEKDRREFPFESCSAHASSSLGKSCCIAAQSRFLPTFTDCASLKLSDPLMLDQCEYEVAIKNLSPDTCSSINDLNLQSSCMVQVKTLNKYPELRENYLFINK